MTAVGITESKVDSGSGQALKHLVRDETVPPLDGVPNLLQGVRKGLHGLHSPSPVETRTGEKSVRNGEEEE